MTPRDWFLVGVRLFGVWWILQGITELYDLIIILAKLYTPQATAPVVYLIHAVVYFVVGWYLLHGLTRPAFPPSVEQLREKDRRSNIGDTPAPPDAEQ